MLSNIREAIDARMRSEDRMRKFLGDTAHELRTPLTVIRGYVDILKQHGEVPADVTERALRRLDSESDRMGRILDDLLLLAKLDEVGVHPEESVDVQAIISELAADLRSRNPHRSVGMNLEGLESISGDADHIERLFVNIFANIERHTPEDAPVLVSSKSTADGTSIVIEDGGPGMSESMMTRLSSGNVRFDSDRNRAHGGVGLGVSIIHSIVREHGGTATYSASILGGTKIEIWFPRQRANYIPAYVR
jgi:two-component system OmpR family sensor kinase